MSILIFIKEKNLQKFAVEIICNKKKIKGKT